MTIDDYLLGHWTNRYQAQSNPLAFASVELIWENDVDPFWYKSKNFYRSEGESRPYRSGRHKLVTIRGDSFLMENYDDNLTRRIGCDMLFEFNNDQWEGTLFTKGACIMNGANVSSHMILFGNKIHQADQGKDEHGNLIWGSDYYYKFTRLAK